MMYDTNEPKTCCCSGESESVMMEKQASLPPIPEFEMKTHDTLRKTYALLEAIDRTVSGVCEKNGSDFKAPENLLENSIANSELASINLMRLRSIAKVLGVTE